jgi:hypothetical protein
MKRNIFYSIIAIAAMFLYSGCSEQTVNVPDFSVKLANGQVLEMIGDTLVCKKTETLKFELEGNPDMLVFFSGQMGSEYKYRNRTEIEGNPTMRFQTKLDFGLQFNSLKVYFSSTFPGITRDEATDRANISNMEYWTDITSQCNLPIVKTSPDNIKLSPTIDLKDYKGKPFYIAFRVVGPKGDESTWTLSNLSIINSSDGRDIEIGTFRTIGFTAFDLLATSEPYKNNGRPTGEINRRWNLTTFANNQITGGGSNDAAFTGTNDDWAISAKIDLIKTRPDAGTAIKGFDQAPLEEFDFPYTKPGVYTITFLGTNSYYGSASQTVKELIVKIID